MAMAMKSEEEPFSADLQKRQVQLHGLIFCHSTVYFFLLKKKTISSLSFFLHVINLVVCQNYGQIVLAGSIPTTINSGVDPEEKTCGETLKMAQWI